MHGLHPEYSPFRPSIPRRCGYRRQLFLRSCADHTSGKHSDRCQHRLIRKMFHISFSSARGRIIPARNIRDVVNAACIGGCFRSGAEEKHCTVAAACQSRGSAESGHVLPEDADVLVTSAGEVDEERLPFRIRRAANRFGNGVGGFEGGDDAFEAGEEFYGF